MTKPTDIYIDQILRNIQEEDAGLPMLHSKKRSAAITAKNRKYTLRNTIVYDGSIDEPKQDNEPKSSSGLNYMMGVDDE